MSRQHTGWSKPEAWPKLLHAARSWFYGAEELLGIKQAGCASTSSDVTSHSLLVTSRPGVTLVQYCACELLAKA